MTAPIVWFTAGGGFVRFMQWLRARHLERVAWRAAMDRLAESCAVPPIPDVDDIDWDTPKARAGTALLLDELRHLGLERPPAPRPVDEFIIDLDALEGGAR